MTSALEFLLAPNARERVVLCALYGDDDYLKQEVLLRLRGGEATKYFVGRETEWRDVRDALTMVSLFGDSAETVVVEQADTFVTEYRDKLEAWVDAPHGERTLILEVKTWMKTTRLAKATVKTGLAIDCGVPDKGAPLTTFNRLARKWLTERATSVHGVKLDRNACERLFDFLPPSLGILDQEVAKLALLAESNRIDAGLVEANVGDWRTRQTWDMIDAMVDGQAAEAMKQLDRLLASGEAPIAVLAQVAYTLRKFATASRFVEQAEAAGRRVSLPQFLGQAGFWKNKLDDAVRQLRQIGRPRAEKLASWLLDADLAMKGHNSTPPRARLELERLIARLSTSAAPARVPAR
ncbi:MAG: DNA polymerase III subunit delta [Aeoliella sp.]